jgi:hypothetical protein
MKTFIFTAKVTISIYTEIDADTLESGIEIANERSLMSIVQNGSDTEKDSWMCDELDGVPYDINEETNYEKD